MITYRELLQKIQTFSEEQLDANVTIFDIEYDMMNSTEQAQAKLQKYIDSFEESKQIYLRVMNKEIDNDAATLMRWIVNNGINPYEVFSQYDAGAMSSLEGFDGLYCQLHNALCNHCDACFVKIFYKTKFESCGKEIICEHTNSPMVVFYWSGENNFAEKVREGMFLPMEDDVFDFQVEVLKNVDEYIKEYERVEEECRKLDEELKHFLS